MTLNITEAVVLRAMHSCFIDALVDQERENADAIATLMDGFDMQHFLSGLGSGFLRFQAIPDRHGEPSVGIEVLADAGYLILARIPPSEIGLDPTSVADAVEAMIARAVADIEDEL